MTDSKTDFNELSVRILAGVQKAINNLVKTAAANNESLVIGNKDGTSQSVPAKKLLKMLSK